MKRAATTGQPEPAVPEADAPRRRADSNERAYALIRKMVIEFQLRPNERLNEVQMARELALSRTPVREAMNRLASEGFLSFIPNRGFYFRSPDIEELVQIYEARVVLEQGSFALACDRATQAQVRKAQKSWASARVEYGKRDPDRILELDEAFHLGLAELSRNGELVRQLAGINARIRFVRRMEIERGPRQASMVGAHDAIMDALSRKAVADGQRLLSEHISMSIEDAASVLKEAIFKAFTRSSAPSAA